MSTVLPEAPPATPQPPRTVEQFQFTGSAAEYFGIWIVNLFLTIVTLGIYSAWAKVRKKRYFYGNTWLAGTNFEYHGNPVAILKGRIVAFIVFAIYSATAHFSPRSAALIAVVVMPAIPYFLVRSFAFNAVNSSYRNLRFHFDGRYREAVLALGPVALVPLLSLILPEVEQKKVPSTNDLVIVFIPLVVFWLIYPYLVGRTRLLNINRSRYGMAHFSCGLTLKDFYWVYAKVTFVFVALGVLFGAIGFAMFWIWVGLLVAAPFLYLALFALSFGFAAARVANMVFNATRLDKHMGFRSTLKARRLAMLYVTNILVILVTLGLMIPWAAIRNARYRAQCLSAECEGGVETFLADVAKQVGATGEEMGEMFNVDFSL